MRVELSGNARRDLIEIGYHIALDNPLRAASFIDELEDRCSKLDQHPKRFPVVSALGRQSVHKLTYVGYVILYVIAPERIDILRIVHGSCDWMDMIDG